jgi:ankyrin repeat protein
MRLSTAINEHNAWFHSRQDEYCSWFLDGGHESMSIMLAGITGLSKGAPIEVPPHSKYILDNGEYSFLLVSVNGEAEKLSQAFELSEENTNIDEDEAIPSTMINTGAGMESVRYIPANSNYEFPLRDEQCDETGINDYYLKAVDEVYGPFFTKHFHAVRAEEEEQETEVNKALGDLMIGNLAKKIVSAYYSVPWVELGEECGGEKEAYEWLVQETFTDFSREAFNKAKEDLVAMVPSDDVEDGIEEQPEVSELWQAILGNEGQKAVELIQAGASVNDMIDINSEVRDLSPLMVAAEHFDGKLVQELIDAGADINAKACEGYVPLTWALKGENLDNFRLLLAAGGNPDPLACGEGYYSPLSMAVYHGLVEAVKELIELGVNVNWVGENGADALKSAAVRGDLACVELLLDAGANPASFDNEGFSPIHNAADEGHHDVVSRLLDAGVDVDLRIKDTSDGEGVTVLHRACSKGDYGLVRMLVERGANVNTVTADFSIPLSAAITDGAQNSEDASDLILYLIKQGAEPDIRTLLISMQTKLPVPIFSIMLKKLLPKMDSPLPFESGEIDKDDIAKAFSYFLSEETDMRRRNDIQKVLEDAGLDILPTEEGDGDIS